MNQSIRKSNAGSKPRPSVSTQPHKNIVVRPKRCHNCQKMIAADKYVPLEIKFRINIMSLVIV